MPEHALSSEAVTGARNAEPDRLRELLLSAFGHREFRPHQEQVCRALAKGQNVLLVMPTGAGKSLCYQLPGLARGGTTIVISPLIALMEDQVSKLWQQGMRAECLHSGRSRDALRAACSRYLKGELDFLFVAPERLAVPGFPEFLARRKPALVAVDEAHCISQWGHDFRPDYRLLRERLPLLQPTPVAALTATATPSVQDDIIAQLGVSPVERHVFGFRRDNIAIEVREAKTTDRVALTLELLSTGERLPAIVYAPTRKEADKQAAAFGELGAAAYHAGLPGEQRERVQRRFLAGEIRVVVATVAFGMGIDKADVRTVIHTALPASVEGYYQEIGRAGRDGLPSRAVLFHSFADLRTHEWFFERDYPEPSVLSETRALLEKGPLTRDRLSTRSSLEPEVLDKVLEKLVIHGGLRLETASGYRPVVGRDGSGAPDDSFSLGKGAWLESYTLQRRHKRAQLDSMVRFAQGETCRMLQLVRHFGDEADSGDPCGQCDACRPELRKKVNRVPLAAEVGWLWTILEALRRRDAQPLGKLFGETLDGQINRAHFQDLVSALSRGGLLEVQEEQFEKDDDIIRFKRATLTRNGHSATRQMLAELQISMGVEEERPSRRRRTTPEAPSVVRRKSSDAPMESELVAALKRWRRDRAGEAPAYRVLTDRALHGIAESRPADERELLAVSGVGEGFLKNHGEELLRFLRNYH
jgi:RecQ family ATP-dependent DNA helicase